MDDFEDSYNDAIEAGRRNLRATKLLSNWCFHAEFARSGGRGMIEATTGLPIGHMGVQCKFSKKNSIFCWLLEDAIYDFYLGNCKGCKEHVPVNIPSILEFIEPREKAAEQRRLAREEEERERKQKQSDRLQERVKLRYKLSLEETFVLDLLDELDQEDVAGHDPRLEQLANLAPETFTRTVIDHLLPAVTHEYLPYSTAAAKALLRTSLASDEKLAVAVRLVSGYEKYPPAVDVVLSGAEKLSYGDLMRVLNCFVSMALGPPPGMIFGDNEPRELDVEPIQELFQKRHSDISEEVGALLSNASPEKIEAGVQIILATNNSELFFKHTRSIFTKLMRRRALLPGERRDSNVLYYLRQAAEKCFERFPEETDKIIQSFLADNDECGRKEANGTYRAVLNHGFREKVQIGTAQRIAFRRLLWAAVESPDDSIGNAGQFFGYSSDELAPLAAEHFDDLIGAAATLSEKYEQVDAEPVLELSENLFSQMEKSNKRTAIGRLQSALINWAAIGAKSKGREGIEEFLSLYQKLPEDQTQMRRKMIVHFSKLLTGVESLNLVLPDWYGALMNESQEVRAGAVQAWEDVPYDLVQNFPDLFFEAFSILIMDPYVIVHQSVVRAVRQRSFPEEKRNLLRDGLWNLICYYSQENNRNDFVVDCISAFSFLCLSPEERRGKFGQLLSDLLFNLEDSSLYHAVDRLHYRFGDVPGFTKVVLKAIQDDYTRSISIDDCESAILQAPRNELQRCVGDIKQAFNALRPFRPQNFREALLYAAALTKAGDYLTASACFKQLKEDIPTEERNEHWRLEAALVATASEIEHLIASGKTFVNLAEQYKVLLSELERENEERDELRDFPPSLFSAD